MKATFIGYTIQSNFINYENIICSVIEELIFDKKVYNFIFGEPTPLIKYCWYIVNQYKYRYGVKKTHYKKDCEYSDEWEEFFDTHFRPKKFYENINKDYSNERWYEMINDSHYIVIYNDGTNKLINDLYNYATEKGKVIYNLYKILK